MANLLKLPAQSKKGAIHVIVETPRGSAAKLEYDPELQAFTLSKSLILGLTYKQLKFLGRKGPNAGARLIAKAAKAFRDAEK